MSSQIQKRLLSQGKRGIPEPFIFAKYCPHAPHNTSQYLIEQYNGRLNPSAYQVPLLASINENIQNLSIDNSMMMEDDGLSIGKLAIHNDTISCCNLNDTPQHLLGSRTSSQSGNSATACSISSQSINCSALE